MSAGEETLVIFRRWPDGSILALFPEIEEDGGLCSSYMHIGQHGAASYHKCLYDTFRAKPEEFASLKSELESIGYQLKIRRRWIRRRGR